MSIRRTIMAVDQPEPITEDRHGKKIIEGAVVAYNRSGEVELGTILNFHSDWKVGRPGIEGKQWWNLKFEMEIKNHKDKNISKVKNPNSFIIISL